MNKILVIQTAFIGDVILATPVLEKLHRFYPDAKIDFLLRKGNEDLLLQHPFINSLLIWDKKENKIANLFKIIQRVRNNKYDLLVNIHRFATSGLIALFSGAKIKSGFDKNPFSFCYDFRSRHTIGNNSHEVERNLLLIEKFTDSSLVKPKLYPAGSDDEKVKEYAARTPYVTVSPTSVWFTKQFPAHKWVKLLRKLEPAYVIYLLGGAGDVQPCEWIRKELGERKVENLAGKLSFLQSAALMQTAVMNYTNDSAPLHMASAMNAPVTAVFCSTVPAFGFGPLSDNAAILEIDHPLYCRPCGLHGYRICPKGHFKCAEDIIT